MPSKPFPRHVPSLATVARVTKSLLRSPSFAVPTVVCLGLGIGVLAAMGALADAYLLRPLPFHQPDRLVAVWKTFEDPGSRGLQYFLRPTDFEFLQDRLGQLEMAAVKSVDVDVTGTEEPVRAPASWATAELASMLGLRMARGRFFTKQEERAEAGVAVVSSSWSRKRWGADAEVLGRELTVEGREYSVIGVLADENAFPSDVALWLPMRREDWEGRLGVSAFGRLVEGANFASARDQIRRAGQRLIEVDPDTNATAGLDAAPLHEWLSTDQRPAVVGLLCAAVAFLLVALANTASLVVARAVRSHTETATRIALGAGRAALARLATCEVGALVGAASILGLLLAAGVLRLLLAGGSIDTPSFAPPRIDARMVIATTLLACTATVVLVSIHLSACRGAGTPGLAVRSVRSPRSRQLMAILVVVDLAITVLLLITSAQAGTTVARMMKLDTGLRTDGLLTAGTSASRAWAESQTQRVAFIDRLLDAVRASPAVESVAAVHALPMTQPEYYWSYHVLGRNPEGTDTRDTVLFRVIAGDYFATTGMQVLEGRGIQPTDVAGSTRVVWANRAFARLVWPDASVLGHQLVSAGGGEPLQVVGVVSDVRERGLARPVEPTLYWPMAQYDRRFLSRMHLLVRSGARPDVLAADLRRRLHQIDPAAVLFDVHPMREVALEAVSSQRFSRTLLAWFAVLAMIQAAAGVYGLATYDVAGRSRELGLRLALGATSRRLIGEVLTEGARRAGLGFALGATCTLVLNRAIDAAWEVGYAPPATYLLVALVLFLVVVTAALPAATRATRLDPAISLKADTR